MNNKELLKRIETKWDKHSEVYVAVRDLINFKVKILNYAIKSDKAQTTMKLDVEKKSGKCLFKNSKLADLEYCEKKIREHPTWSKKYKGANVSVYLQKLTDWSDKKNRLCTDRGWFVYLRQFMDSDIKNGKLIRLKNQGQFDLEGYVPQV